METFLQEFEDFKEAVRRRANRITEQWKEAGDSRGGEQGACHGRKSKKATARCFANAKGAYADPDALPTQDSEELIEAAGRPLLTGWEEIGQAIGNVSVRTAQRWERKHGLPVGHVGRIAVADPDEIRKWKEQQGSASETRL